MIILSENNLPTTGDTVIEQTQFALFLYILIEEYLKVELIVMIDVIIPAYNSHGTIIRTLSSIAMQLNRKELKITIVNDGGKVLHAATYEWHYNEALETINITCNIDRTLSVYEQIYLKIKQIFFKIGKTT